MNLSYALIGEVAAKRNSAKLQQGVVRADDARLRLAPVMKQAQSSLMRASPSLAVLMTLSATMLVASTPPPPPIMDGSGNPASRVVLSLMPGEVRCGGIVETPALMRRPQIALGWPSPRIEADTVISYDFRIDAAGRPLSISSDRQGFTPYSEDIGPSLAASRFRPGSERTGCRISYALRATTIAQTPVEDLVAYTMTPQHGPLPRNGWDRIRPDGATCVTDPRSAPLLRAFPDFDKLAATPGVRDWTMVRYDIDAKGRPVKVQVAYTTRNTALDAASVKAVEASRFTQGPRTGCMYPYWRAPARLEAPASPDPKSLQSAAARCDGSGEWAKMPPLLYPQPYRKHSIEGWAIVAFDLAPWGEPGNIRTLAAEPAADFGKQAEQMLRMARAAPSHVGKSGCVQKIRFVMGQPGAPANAEDQDAPPTPF